MESIGIESFLKITGPWGLLAILIAFMWDMFRRNDKSLREILSANTAILDQMVESLASIESRVESVEISLADFAAQLKTLIRLEDSA